MWTHTKESQNRITPEMAIDYLKDGNRRFLDNLKVNRNLLKQVNLTSEGQFPFAAILSCIDSRTSAEIIFDQGLGDIFSIRIAGNVLNEDIIGSMEYACQIAGSRLVLVLGHTKCGAIMSACDNQELGHFTGLLGKLRPAMESEKSTLADRNSGNISYVNRVSLNNVEQTVRLIRVKSRILDEMERSGAIRITGGLYDIETGVVSFLEYL